MNVFSFEFIPRPPQSFLGKGEEEDKHTRARACSFFTHFHRLTKDGRESGQNCDPRETRARPCSKKGGNRNCSLYFHPQKQRKGKIKKDKRSEIELSVLEREREKRKKERKKEFQKKSRKQNATPV